MTANDPYAVQSVNTDSSWMGRGTDSGEQSFVKMIHFDSSLQKPWENLPQHCNHDIPTLQSHRDRATPRHLSHTWGVRRLRRHFTQLDCAEPGFLKTLAFISSVINLPGWRESENQSKACCHIYGVTINKLTEKLNDVFRFDGGAWTWTNLCTLADDHLPDCVLFCCSEFSQWIQISFLESYECVHSLMADRRRTYIVYI